MGRFFHKFSSRMVMGEILIHGLLASALFILILPAAEQYLEDHFIERSIASARQLSSTLESFDYPPDKLDSVRSGHLRLIHLNIQDGSFTDIETDTEFGDTPDNIYQIAIPILIGSEDYILQLGYDENQTLILIDNARKLGMIIVVAYILLAALITAIIGTQLTKPLRQLGMAARNIASGNQTRRLGLHSSISEVNQLINDLELMRRELVSQSDVLATREDRLSNIMANVVDALITFNQQGKILSFNMAAERIFGYSASEVINQNINSLFNAQIFNDNDAPENIALAVPFEIMGVRQDGTNFYIEATINQTVQTDDRIYIVNCRDISKSKKSETKFKTLQDDLERRVIQRTREIAELNKELKHQSLHDSLTSLPNRVLLKDRLSQAIRAAKRDNRHIALLITDLDRFKEINDTLGHNYGDMLLQQVAARLRGMLRDSDTVARLGGDEFAILLPNINAKDQVTQMAVKIARAIELPFIFEDQKIHIGISIGIAIFPNDGDSTRALMRQADVAMYVAKRSNEKYIFYTPELDNHSISRLSMAGELRQGLKQKQIVVHYQPNVDLRLNKIVGVEALARWQHPEKGLLPPDEFISLAEHSGYIRELTAYILEESIQQLHLWSSTGLALKMSVNLSSSSLHDRKLVNYIKSLLEKRHIKPSLLQLEITEQALMYDPAQAMATLTQLNEMGIKLSIDDFGTGYSSLAYLKQLPIHEIKIDQSFINAMLENNADKIIVRSTIDLAHNMGHQVIAEGVDNEAALLMLTEMGCDLVQGYYISNPVTADELRQWLQHSNWQTA